MATTEFVKPSFYPLRNRFGLPVGLVQSSATVSEGVQSGLLVCNEGSPDIQKQRRFVKLRFADQTQHVLFFDRQLGQLAAQVNGENPTGQ